MIRNPHRRSYLERLGELQRRRIMDDIAKREDVRRDPVLQHALSELARLKPIVRERWPGRELIQLIRDGLGWELQIGYFGDSNKQLPPWKRREVVVARGRSYSEVLENLHAVERAM